MGYVLLICLMPLNSKTNLYVNSVSDLKDFSHNLNVERSYNVFCTPAFMSEIFDGSVTSTARGVVSKGSEAILDFFLLVAGSPSTIRSFRYNIATDELSLSYVFTADS